MTKILPVESTIGIIGAGQLGKMLAQSAQKFGYRVAMYDPNPSSCGFDVSHEHTTASFDDEAALVEFVQSVDVVTYEFENINGPLLKQIESSANLPQGTELLLKTQDRMSEKTWLRDHHVPTVAFTEITDWASLEQALEDFAYPFVIKTNRLGYDGKGQVVVKDAADLKAKQTEIEELLEKQSCILEAFCDFEYEASVIVARDLYGNIETFPVSVNEHINGILYSSLVGADLPATVQEQINDYAGKIAQAGKLIGVCGVEFFVTGAGEVVVNEVAPRPHNSGHYTIEACNVSQFDQHILALTGHPLIDIRLMEPALMINILGQHMSELTNIKQALPQAVYHVYNKGEARSQRKMGHFTITDPSYAALEEISKSNENILAWRELF